ncbi:uncharacterized protein Z518_00749 [Rhinocladiella mackenziei CBS 650.93]|uniref:Putative gamma-glutamylcyclotransferase n=1 Tax=Rhinocladiella mackenziei CBS 650.93 TaxID=1442369 RepID=A0A0D2HG76_9EURO|nr:uncharacterized protein Z518_00749 [Rhinocladiella mackenziei CBS 650.93]KIX09668.1 hypothetical protein Z518_00749 [Rhinocladiella mackenziei CBS 650.93]
MAPGVLHRVIHGTHDPEPWQKSLLTVRPAMLQSYRRHRVRHADYPAILAHEGSCVRGSVVSGLTRGDLYRLDIFEGDQYSRQKVKVQVLKDIGLDEAAEEGRTEVIEEVEAETYVWGEGEKTLEAKEWDFEEFKRDKMKAWMGMVKDETGEIEVDEGFADVDHAVAEQQQQDQEGHDPMGGRGANGHITQQLKNAAVLDSGS